MMSEVPLHIEGSPFSSSLHYPVPLDFFLASLFMPSSHEQANFVSKLKQSLSPVGTLPELTF